jgi:hypothetical protein
MRKLFKKFKNIHFLWIVGVICFLTFYIPVGVYTEYTGYIPEWTLPLFIFGTMIPLWGNEFLWRTARFNSSHYMMFHDLHFENKKWVKQTANVWLILTKYGIWSAKRLKFWIVTVSNIACLIYGYYNLFPEEIFAFSPFYMSNSIWWIIIIKEFSVFKMEVEDGYVRYGKVVNDGPRTHFSPEWYEERERVFIMEEERRKKLND